MEKMDEHSNFYQSIQFYATSVLTQWTHGNTQQIPIVVTRTYCIIRLLVINTKINTQNKYEYKATQG